MRAITALCVLIFTIAGCGTSVSSRQLNFSASERAKTPAGLHYSAPKAVFSVLVVQASEDGDVYVEISPPIYQGDPDATFVLRSNYAPFADKRYNLEVDPETRLLSIVNSQSIGRLDDVIENIAGAAGKFRAADESGAFRTAGRSAIYQKIFDPMMQPNCGFGRSCDLTEISDDIQNAIVSALSCQPTEQSGEAKSCTLARSGQKLVEIRLEPLFRGRSGGRSGEARTCRRSICYRAPVPYELRMSVAGGANLSDIVYLPNDAPMLGINIASGAFADAKTVAWMIDGMPVRLRSDQQSELAAASAVPISAIDAFYTGTSELLSLRIKTEETRKEFIEARDAADEAAAESETDGLSSQSESGALDGEEFTVDLSAPDPLAGESARPDSDGSPAGESKPDENQMLSIRIP